MTTIDLVKIAFRKLKAHVYFDKTVLPLRDKVVKFEARKDFHKKLDGIAKAYDSAALGMKSLIMSEILSSINILPFPKKMQSIPQNDNTVISVGNPKEKPMISELQYFIDMDVRGHILGILWIMAFGKRLDDMCFENSRGNRLRKALIWNEENDIINSPALFEPYFAQYTLWRDDGLSCAEDMLSKGHDALIVTLDLKKFYYRAGITKETFNEITNDEDSASDKSIHLALFNIMKRYTQILEENAIEHSGIALPIGFLPSAVLSNWCLSKFDKGILDFWNPIYYGRYVDDIIIIEKVEKGSELCKKAKENNLTKEYVIDYYLGSGRRKNAYCFVTKSTSEKLLDNPSTSIKLPMSDDEKNSDGLYRVNSIFCLSEDSTFEFQAIKTRIIALFAENNSTALINKFKKEIYENVSEFRLMPEIGEAFSQDDFSLFYRLDNDATINKLRGVKEIVMDKYELSKFLGKYRVVSGLVDDGSTKKFTRIIGKMFNDRELIDNYILWERVFEIFITDKDYNGFSKFAKRIKSAIDSLVIENDEIMVEATKESLRKHLFSSLNRVLSLIWGEKADSITQAINEGKTTISLRKAYIENRMSNKYVMSVPLENISCPIDSDVNFTDFAEGFKYVCDNATTDDFDEEFLPYFRQAQDVATAMFIKSICNDYKNSPEDLVEILQETIDAPISATKISDLLSNSNSSDNVIIRIGDQKASKLKIGIANVNVSEAFNLENILKGRKPNRKPSRYRALAKLVNDAIAENVDMLVLPENYVPFEWLSALATKAAREGLAIVTGIEHLVIDKRVYNYTAVILPFRYFKTIPTSAIFFQLKKHYAPDEKRIIDGYGFSIVEETEKRPLYRWCDCYFPVYCCFELADINDRAEFMSWADMVVAVEFNKDTPYFSSIVESLTRDLHCYCVQVNTSEYGDSRITQPTKSEERNLINVKGGLNQVSLIGEIDIQSLREFQIKDYTLQKGGSFKPTPPGIDINVVRWKIENMNK